MESVSFEELIKKQEKEGRVDPDAFKKQTISIEEAKKLFEKSTKKKRSKYNNERVEFNGYMFDSIKEKDRYITLSWQLRIHEISDLHLQVRFPFLIDGKVYFEYIADFVYKKKGEFVVEDVKGYKTDVYKLKKKLIEAVYKISILET